MKRRITILLLVCGLCASAQAQAQAPQQLMQQISGVYKERFQSAAIVPGKPDEPYQAEDVIEIVPYDADHLYVRTHLDFYNGHTCDISGMARYENGAFVYHDPERLLPDEPPCALKVGIVKDKLVITDRTTPDAVSSCSAYCGVRGSLNYSIGLDKRRPIRYLDRLKASRQYAHAIDDLHRTEPDAAGKLSLPGR
jgi:hypothetical protein